MSTNREWCARVAFVALVIAAPTARAQSPADSSRAPAALSWPIAAWVSLGLGPGTGSADHSGGIAIVARATVSVGELQLGYRYSDDGPFIGGGSGVRERAVLVGLRTPGRRLFGSASAGYGRANAYRQCDGCGGPDHVAPGVGVLPYEIVAHATLPVAGLAIGISGAAGPTRVRYSAVTVALELGWFGR
jgi:hypothetical protein